MLHHKQTWHKEKDNEAFIYSLGATLKANQD